MAAMMGLGMTEIIVVLVLALIVIGPDKLPGIAYKIGKGWGEFRRTFDDVKDSFSADIRRSANEVRQPPPPSVRAVPNTSEDNRTESTIDTPDASDPDNTPEDEDEHGPVG